MLTQEGMESLAVGSDQDGIYNPAMRLRVLIFVLAGLAGLGGSCSGQGAGQVAGPGAGRVAGHSGVRVQRRAEICAACVRAELGFLANDELHGRGSGTRDEHLAALYAASLFQSFGLEPGLDPAGENGGYIQRAPLPDPLPEKLAERLKKHGFDQNQRTDTWNVLALLRGTDAGAAPAPLKDVILLTAHLDHLGLGEAVNGDSIYNGADDDASGTTAVLELAR